MIKIPNLYSADPPNKSNDPPLWSPVRQKAEGRAKYMKRYNEIMSIEDPNRRQWELNIFNNEAHGNKDTLRGDLPDYETFNPVEQFIFDHRYANGNHWTPIDMINPAYYLNNLRKASDGIRREYDYISNGGNVRTGNIIQIGLDIADGIPPGKLIAKFGKKAVQEFILQEGIEQLIQYGIDNGWDDTAVESLRNFDPNEFFSIEEPNPDIKGWGSPMPMN